MTTKKELIARNHELHDDRERVTQELRDAIAQNKAMAEELAALRAFCDSHTGKPQRYEGHSGWKGEGIGPDVHFCSGLNQAGWGGVP